MKVASPLAALGLISPVCFGLTWQNSQPNALIGSYFGTPGEDATYDYVVVGGGLAGLVVAKRLAEDRSISVAVVEAGTFYEISNGNKSQVPLYSRDYVSADPTDFQPFIDWGLDTVPQPQLGGRVMHYAQGKCLGGSSGRNQMIYHRGTKGSYDLWAREVADDSFSWDNMLPYFEKSMTFTPPDTSIRAANATTSYNASAYSTNGGPLQVSFPKYATPFASWGIKALKAIGLPMAVDFSSGVLNGSAYNPFTINPTDSLRSSSETSFLQEAIDTELPLTVYPMSQAMQIMFDSDKRATGVTVQSAGYNYTLSARQEVIVSAGAYHSPQLLMVSGIGPAETLQKNGIDVIADRPGVGQNMHDSCNIDGVTHGVPLISSARVSSDAGFKVQAEQQFLQDGSGILTNSGGDVLSWEKLPEPYRSNLSNSTRQKLARWPSDWPEIEIVLQSSGKTLTGSAGDNNDYATLGVLLVGAISRGNMTINSSSMADKPVISTNWLLDEADQEIAVQAYRQLREAWKHIPIATTPETAPGANVTSHADILASIKKNMGAVHHATSSCMMGRANETMAVVDGNAKVSGVQKLRVIDSSSFRFTPPGHTQGATYAHAEKLVDDIKKGL
ncbi:hypothetical protein MBLNU230_g2881t1 [Neophaeotheca triangularis]